MGNILGTPRLLNPHDILVVGLMSILFMVTLKIVARAGSMFDLSRGDEPASAPDKVSPSN